MITTRGFLYLSKESIKLRKYYWRNYVLLQNMCLRIKYNILKDEVSFYHGVKTVRAHSNGRQYPCNNIVIAVLKSKVLGNYNINIIRCKMVPSFFWSTFPNLSSLSQEIH